MSCNVCGKQNKGSTTERVRFRWSNYKYCHRKAGKGDCMKKYLNEQSLSESHNSLINDLEINLDHQTRLEENISGELSLRT